MTCLQRLNSENGTQEQGLANDVMAPDGLSNQELPLLLPLTSVLRFQDVTAPAPPAAAPPPPPHASSQHRPSLSEQQETLINIIDLVLDLLVDEDDLPGLFQARPIKPNNQRRWFTFSAGNYYYYYYYYDSSQIMSQHGPFAGLVFIWCSSAEYSCWICIQLDLS